MRYNMIKSIATSAIAVSAIIGVATLMNPEGVNAESFMEEVIPVEEPEVPEESLEIEFVDRTTTSITFEWNDINIAEYYKLSCYDNTTLKGQSNVRLNAVLEGYDVGDATSYKVTGLTPGHYYTARIEAFDENDKLIDFDNTDVNRGVYTKVDKVTGLKKEYFGNGAKLTWDEIPAASYYEYELYDHNNKKIKKSTIGYINDDSNSAEISQNLLTDNLMTIKVRAVTYACCPYMEHSHTLSGEPLKMEKTAWASIKIIRSPSMKDRLYKDGKVNLTWNKIKGATGYEIYASTKKKSVYKKIATIKGNKTKYTVKKINGKKIKKNKNYYFYVISKYKKGNTNIKSEPHYTYKIQKKKNQQGTISLD